MQLNGEKALGFIDFHIQPHLNSPKFPQANEDYLKRIAKNVKAPIYGIADGVAPEIINGKISIVGAGDRIILNRKIG